MFFKSNDSKASKEWFKTHLGFNTDDYGCTFWWKYKDGNNCSTQWSPFPEDTKYYEPSKKEFLFDYRAENLNKLLEVLKQEGATIVGKMEEYNYGKFVGF